MSHILDTKTVIKSNRQAPNLKNILTRAAFTEGNYVVGSKKNVKQNMAEELLILFVSMSRLCAIGARTDNVLPEPVCVETRTSLPTRMGGHDFS